MILHGDALTVLRTLPANSVHCVVTSPPYWSLRDYGVPPTVWGGNPRCDHEWTEPTYAEGFSGKRKWQHGENGRGEQAAAPATSQPSGSRRGLTTITRAAEPDVWTHVSQGVFCRWCGAWRGCLGLEPTPDLYVAHVVMLFDEVRRVLRLDGTCWLNIGDSYAGAGGGGDTGRSGLQGSTRHQDESKKAGQRVGHRSSFRRDRAPRMDVPHKGAPGLKPKDLCMIPARVALALQAAGWYLRADIVWAKTNPMPESITDRPTKSHEYIFLLAKSERYFYDADAIREGVSPNTHSRGRGVSPKSAPARSGIKANVSFHAATNGRVGSRNRRSVWTLPTQPYKGAHFATFPPRLIEPCLLAGTSAHGCCALCGAPYRRIVERGAELIEQKIRGGCNKDGTYHGAATKDYDAAGAQDPSAVKARILKGMRERQTVGWRPTCRHELSAVEPCVVLDPFAGTGTTGMVAAAHALEFIGIELNEHYIALAEQRSTPKGEATA